MGGKKPLSGTGGRTSKVFHREVVRMLADKDCLLVALCSVSGAHFFY